MQLPIHTAVACDWFMPQRKKPRLIAGAESPSYLHLKERDPAELRTLSL